MKKTILLTVIGLFSLSYADDNSPILDYYKPAQFDSLDKRVSYIESTFNAKIENIMEQIKSIQNKQNDYEEAMKYIATQTKKEIEELKTQVEMLTEEMSKLKDEESNDSVYPKEESIYFCTTNSMIFITDFKGKVIARVNKGSNLEVLGETKKAYKVKYNDKVGYVSKKYCKLGG